MKYTSKTKKKKQKKTTLQTELNKLKKAFEKMGTHLESEIQKN